MTAPTATAEYLTPPQLSAEWGCDVHHVLNLIRSGQLIAVNLAAKPNGRPRLKISRAAIDRFLTERTVAPAVRVARRRRQKDEGVIKFF